MEYAFDYLVHFFSLAWVLLGLTVVSALPFHFLDNHGVMGFISWLSFGLLECFGTE